MDVIKAARALGKAIQQDERYLVFKKAKKANDADIELNGLIGKLNLIQLSYQNESAKDEHDNKKLEELDAEYSEVYGQIMLNKNMRNYENAKNDIDEMMNYLIKLLSLCVNGADPETCEPLEENKTVCGENCAMCTGCG